MSFKIYDKVSWHFPEGKGCPSLEVALRHFKAIMTWLQKNSLLSKYGLYIANEELGNDFSITTEMLTSEGNKLLELYYDQWLTTIDYSSAPSIEFWNETLRKK